MDVRIKIIDTIQVARIGHVGRYAEVGPCFERLFRWASGIGVPTGRIFTLSWDNGEGLPADGRRSDDCAEMGSNEEPPPGIELVKVGSGRFAVYRLVGSYEGITKAYRRVLGEWLSGSGEPLECGP